MTSDFDCFIFDMDGVLIDSEPRQYILEKQLFSEIGFSLSEDEHKAFLGINHHDMFTDLKRRFRFSPSVDELVGTLRRRYLEDLETHPLPLKEGALWLVSWAFDNGMELALASSAPREQIDFVMDYRGLRQFFPVQISGDDVEYGKPHPEIFLTAATSLGVHPCRCCVIEDSPNGVRAAETAGMACIGVSAKGFDATTLDQADWVVDSLLQIPVVIGNLRIP